MENGYFNLASLYMGPTYIDVSLLQVRHRYKRAPYKLMFLYIDGKVMLF